MTQTAEISTRSISVEACCKKSIKMLQISRVDISAEAVPEIPKLSRPRRPDPHSMELGLQQACLPGLLGALVSSTKIVL